MFRKIDAITITLSLVIVMFTAMLSYLYDKAQHEKNFAYYHNKLEILMFIEKDFDTFLHSSLYFTNYDHISKELNNFDTLLSSLESSFIFEHYGKDITNKLVDIRKAFTLESNLLEYHKSINSVTRNSIHYLFDLRRSISDSKNISIHEKQKIDELFFLMMQLYSGLETQEETVKNILLKSKKHSNVNINYFYTQSNIFIKNMKYLQDSFVEHKEIDLMQKIDVVMTLLEKVDEQQTRDNQKLNILFTLGLIMLLLILIILHRRSLRVHKELSSFKLAIEHSDNSIVMTDLDHNILYVNESFEKNTGYTKSEVMGKNPRILKSGLTDEHTYVYMQELLEKGKAWNGEFINQRKDGSIFYERAYIMPIVINDIIDSYLAIKLDITEYILQEEHMRLAGTVFDNVDEGIVVTDIDQTIVSVNKALENMLGYKKDECIGNRPVMFQSEDQGSEFYKNIWDEIYEKGSWQGKVKDQTKLGDNLTVWLSISVVKDKNNSATNYIFIHRNLADIIKSQERIDFLAYHDSLTELPNRFSFEESLTHSIKMAKSNQTKFSILFIDLDRFKVINDTLGHHVGDALLKEVANIISELADKKNTLARIGGDEFVLVLENIHSNKEAASVASQILEKLSQPIKALGHTLNTSASIGIANYPSDAKDVVTLLKYADSAMYKAKDLGKNRFHFFTNELSNTISYRLQIEQELRFAISKNELYLNFQPQYDLKTKKTVSVEALLRWNSASLGVIPPDKFIPIAEDSGLIVEIGYFVFRESCAFLQASNRAGHGLERIAINVSTQQFQESDLVERFLEIVEEFGLSTESIEIEITERYIMESSTDNLNILASLRSHGFKISIDDFGTGYSSMSYLKKLPVDTIKIDKSFVDDLPDDPHNVAITNAIIVLANSLGYHTIAEGIELEVQENFLTQNSCEIGQGYLFSKPLNIEQFFEFMKS
jgi:diguanylate cyclase (GGDEF)-like protein/PAS domain S-box-containing protein